MNVNDKEVVVEAHAFDRLLDVLRHDLKLTGSKEGCGEGECGACSVFLEGELVNSCLVPMIQMQGAKIKTIEGVAQNGELHAVQKTFIKDGGAQCGICTPGMIMAAVDLVQRYKDPTTLEIQTAISGNLCRCTGYTKIVTAVANAAKAYAESQRS
jgi:carbon-monoxide dehydrogenase small subunit